MGGVHAHHLRQVLQEHYEISEDCKGGKFAGIDLEWNYAPTHKYHTCRLSIKGYIEIILTIFVPKRPTKPQLLPHKHLEIHYGANVNIGGELIKN